MFDNLIFNDVIILTYFVVPLNSSYMIFLIYTYDLKVLCRKSLSVYIPVPVICSYSFSPTSFSVKRVTWYLDDILVYFYP